MLIRLNKILIILAAPFLVSACAVTHAPFGWLPNSAADMQTEAYGSWIEVHYDYYKAGNKVSIFQKGELIAVEPDSLYLMNQDSLVVIGINNISEARLVNYESHAGETGGWVFLGTLSTISHGFYLLVTAPVLWLLAGSIASASHTHDPVMDSSNYSISSFSPYARFPQGLPKDLNRKTLKPKPFKQ